MLKSPNHRTARLWLSNIYTVRGEFEKAEAEVLKVQEIDPLSFGVRLTLAELYWYWRKPDKVIEQANLMLLTNPTDEYSNVLLFNAYLQKGDFETAMKYLEKAPTFSAARAIVFAKTGREEEARKIVAEFAVSETAKSQPYSVASLYAAIGEKEKALAWLEKSYESRQATLISLKVDPNFDSLRDASRYADLLKKIHLAE